jgi:hypothetical protein
MKRTSVLFLSAAALFGQGAELTTGQAARLVIGQRTFTSQDSNSSDIIVGAVSGLAFAADTLFVADANRVGAGPSNHRVLVYRGTSSMLPSPQAELAYDRKCPVCVGKASVVLGQPDFTTTTVNIPATRSALRLPTAVASDGVRLVVADTDHNRVLIWNSIPTQNNQPADVVVGQPDFTSLSPSAFTPTAKTMRGPQGVWIQNGKLYVADTQNDRVLVFNRIPTTNGASADIVLGQPDFTTFVQPDLTLQTQTATASNMQNPVAVSSDGVRLFVTDLGYNRVLIWNSIPASNGAAADVAIGQPDLTSTQANNAYTVDENFKQTPVLCTEANGKDEDDNPTYPAACNATLNFPRFALSTGNRLFVADGGNDRVLVWNTIPTANGSSADLIIGQISGGVNQASDAADSLRTPMSLAWDGLNLYVSDAYNRRITVYTLGATSIPYQGVRNAASINILAIGQILISGEIQAKDTVSITVSGTAHTYTIVADDTLEKIVQELVNLINGSNEGEGDPDVIATADVLSNIVVLTARQPGRDGNNIIYSASVATTASSATPKLQAFAAGTNLIGGADAAKVAPGTIVSITGTDLTTANAAADMTQGSLPTKLAGTTVYFNGIAAPLYYVSPTQINAQIPWEVNDTTSINAYVRSERGSSIVVTTPVAATIVPANPGIFTQNVETREAMAIHGSSNAIGIVSVDGAVVEGDISTVTIEDRAYSYTAVKDDTILIVRDKLVELINADPKVTASPSGQFTRILIRARIQGPEGNGIAMAASASASASVILTAFSQTLCCANIEGAPITPENPAVPGEVIVIYATGLGLPVLNDTISSLLVTGQKWPVGGPVTEPTREQSVSSLAGGKTADVLSATLLPGTVGTFQVILHLNGDMPSDPETPITIAQDVYVSNVVTIPMVNPIGQ